MYVDPAEFIEFCSSVETKIALKCGLQRGWFSYTDLTQFLVASQYQTILKDIIEHTVKVKTYFHVKVYKMILLEAN